jgi:hypothetical protein
MADWTGRIAFGSFDVTSLNNNLLARRVITLLLEDRG